MNVRPAHIARVIAGTVLGVVAANLLLFLFPWLLVRSGGAELAGLDAVDEGYLLQTGGAAVRLALAGGWLVGAGAGALLAFIVGRSDWPGWVVAGWVAASQVALVLNYPYPLWLRLVAVAGPFVGALFAHGLYRRWRAARLHLHR